MSDKVIHLIRHCEAEHNPQRHFHIRDPVLTVRGREQAVDLNATLFDNVQQDVQLVVSSPMRRAMQTAIIALGEANRRLGKENMILLPHAQECNAYPCDIGSPVKELSNDPEFEGIDFYRLSKVSEWTSKRGFWSSDPACLRARAKFVRRWLRNRPETHIVLVSHGSFLRYMLHGAKSGDCFENGEVRSYTFLSDGDEDAWLNVLDAKAG